MHKILIFPSGTSFGNTCQIVRTAMESKLFNSVKILSSNETQDINRHLVDKFNLIDPDFILDSVSLNRFIKNPADFLSPSDEINFLIGPSTVEYQLETFAALCAINPPRAWGVFEKRTKHGFTTRELRSFDVRDSIPLVEISSNEIHQMLPRQTSLQLKEHGVAWQVSQSRFNYHMDFHSITNHSVQSQRKWEQNQYAIINQLREYLGVHGLTSTHSPLPDHWLRKEGVLRRLNARGIREMAE